MVKINFSGHPVDSFEVSPFVGINLPTDGKNLASLCRETLLSLPGREGLLKGDQAEIILPGLSQAAGTLLAEWHGQFGGFPNVQWSVRGETGFTWPEEAKLNLADVRESARTAR